MNILITGGAGFIGCNLAAHFLRAGHAVTIFDNFSRRGGEANLAWLQAEFPGGLPVIRGDVRDAAAIAQAAQGRDAIFHLAGQVAVTTSVLDPRRDFEDNALGTFNTLEAARLSGNNPIFIYTSTNKVYGGMEAARVVDAGQRYAFADMPHGVSEDWPIDFHSPYGCCYSEDTDVLTRCGWRRFYELNEHDDVLTYSLERRRAEFQRPTAHFAFPYTGPMYVQRNRRLWTCVTPNHKMLVSWDCNHDELERPRLLEAQAIAGKPMAYLVGAEHDGGQECEHFVLPGVIGAKHKHDFSPRPILMEDWLRFLGWYLAEGHCYESAKTGNCTVTLTTYYRTDEALAVMRAVGLSPVVDKHHVVATSRQMYTYVRQFGKSHDKFIPHEVKQLHPRYLRTLLQALLDGDGNRVGKNSWRYTTVSKQLADDMQEIALKCGLSTWAYRDREGFHRVSLSTTRTVQTNLNTDRSSWVDYSGKVYCVEVPNSVVLVRQNGYAYFSGNSKGAGDQYVRDYHRIYGLPTVVFRQSSIYGPRQFGIEDQGWIAFLAICAATGQPITIYGDGKQVRDILYVDDLARAFEAAIARIDRAAGQIYNIGGGPERTLSIWTETGPLLEQLAGRTLPVRFSGWRPGDQRIYLSDIRKAQAELGWTPQIAPAEGVRRLWEWIQANIHLFRS
jgi:nucleoside-diphosphate-sugar epimerase